MVETKILNTPKKRHLNGKRSNFEIENDWAQSETLESRPANNVVAGINKKEATITELPINGYLTIDDNILNINQVIPINDISRVKFNIENEVQSTNYGNFKLIANQGSPSEEEYYFVIDADIINNDQKTNDNEYTLKNKKLEKELQDFIAKRESGIVFDTKGNSWVDATKSPFEEDFFAENQPKNETG